MGLYTRAEYEEDCKRIDRKIAISASLLGERLIGPLQHEQYAKGMEEIKRKLGQKLAMTALAIVDKKRTQKSRWFAWVIGAQKEHESNCARKKKPPQWYCNCSGEWRLVRRKGPLLKHVQITQGKWRDSNLGEIVELERSGVTVVESGWGQKRPQKAEMQPEEGVELLEWHEIDSYEYERLQTAGHWIYLCKEGRCKHEHTCPIDGGKLWFAHYMFRTEGDKEKGQGVKYYVANVG